MLSPPPIRRIPAMRTPLPLLLAVVGLVAAPLAARPLFRYALDPQQAAALSNDPSIAKVVDREGTGLARGGSDPRWRGAEENDLLFANEWVKTGARGANALQLRMKSGATLTLGPGAQVELVDAATVRVTAGEVELAPREGAPLTLRGPGDETRAIAATTVVRARDRKLETLATPPAWLTGYQSGQSTEAMGSLLATIDGREVPLTLGYHKVSVEIRDQVARTIVEESFVNHTPSVLEGVFYFPLPADASISSFGMWIGDELVEGDIVEKERARAIYEQILREKRDPGLLEWTGGNLFKARVYPIVGEKRIKLGWTQLLKKRGDQFTWNYALQSELLRRNPLKQLAIEVTISSAEPLAAVACPSHECRIAATDHAASVSFDAQEYRPDRDFELRIATKPAAAGGAPLSFVADQRGDDGYFMVRFAPSPATAIDPGLATKPSDWLLLCDTSGSLRGPARATQLQFVEALLGSLGDHDTLQLATADVETRFAFPGPVAASDANRAAALDFLAQREALGWSDLAGAFGKCLPALREGTQLVYVGDGIATLGDADPAKCAAAITAAWKGRGRVHAVVPGNAQEPVVLRAATKLGDGSLRVIGGGSDALQVAQQLLADATAWRATGLALEFDGLPVAAVHPQELPSLAAGEQQVVVGRYDARTAHRGTVRVTSRNAAPLELPIVLDDLGEDASFLPRLWARHHLDSLLAQPATKEIRERAIALSEEFQIVTPWTSFLVLESEADRQRFQVEKRTRMRDGEEYFAKGRADAAFELTKAQMQKAQQWNVGLRRELLASLARLDRDLTEVLRPQSTALAWGSGVDEGGYGFSTRSHVRGRSGGGYYRGPGDAAAPSLGGAGSRGLELDESRTGFDGGEQSEEKELLDIAGEPVSDPEEPGLLPEAAPSEESYDDAKSDDDLDDATLGKSKRRSELSARAAGGGGKLRADRRWEAGRLQLPGGNLKDGFAPVRPPRTPPADPFASLFADVMPPATAVPPAFDGEVGALLASLERRGAIATLEGGLRLVLVGATTDARGRTWPLGRGEALLARDAWCVEPQHRDADEVAVEWLRGGERGRFTAAWRMGRVRAALPGDAADFPPLLSALFDDVGARFRGWTATLLPASGGKQTLRFTAPWDPTASVELDVDLARRLVVEERWSGRDGLASRLRATESVEVAGRWWPTKIVSEQLPDGARVDWSLAVAALERAAFDAELARALAPRADALELRDLPKSVEEAKNLVAAGKATLEARWLLLRAASARDDHDGARAEFAAFAALAPGRRALDRVELTLLAHVRERETLRQRLLALCAALAATPERADLARGEELWSFAGLLGAGDERLALLRALDPLVARQADQPWVRFAHAQRVLGELRQTARSDDGDALVQRIAAEFPDRVEAHVAWAQLQAQRGELDAGLATLADAVARHAPWSGAERGQLDDARVDLLWNGYRLETLAEETALLLRERPDSAPPALLDRFMAALVMLDREALWWETIVRWLDDARAAVAAAKPLTGAQETRLGVAVRQALGQGQWCSWWYRRFSDMEARTLADAALELIDDERAGPHATQLLGFHSLAATLEARAAHAALWKRMEGDADRAAAATLARRVTLLRGVGFQPAGEEATWKLLFDRLFARSKRMSDDGERRALEELLVAQAPRPLQLDVLREQLARAKGDEARAAATLRLVHSLLAEPFTDAVETELLALLPGVAAGPERILAWHDFVDWSIEARVAAELKARPDFGQLARKKLKVVDDERRKVARTTTRARLVAALQAAPDRVPVEWLQLDRIALDVWLRRDLAAARADALALLRAALDATRGKQEDEIAVETRCVARRAATTLLFLLTSAEGDERAAQERELVALTDAASAAGHALLDWRQLDWERLVALDRGDELAARLSDWLGDGSDFTRQRFARQLAWLHAERGELAKALELVARLDAKGEMGHDDWMAAAAWNTALGRQEEAARARLAAWSALDEWTLADHANRARWSTQDRGDGVPAALPEETFEQLIALMRKASWPEQQLWTVRDLYAKTKEFRLLQCLPDAVIGHTPQGIYRFLAQAGELFTIVDEEATVDRVVAGLATAREQATGAVDRRALDYLEFLARWRAAAQQNGGAPHRDAALTAMKRAFATPTAPGEEVPLAEFLAGLAGLGDGALQEEQLRQLAELLRRAAAPDDTRLALAASLATAQWNANRWDEALRTLTAELGVRKTAAGGRLPDSANGPLAAQVARLATRARHADAETLLLDERARAPNAARTAWLDDQLHVLWARALREKGRVAFGEGRELFAKARAAIVAKLAARTNEQVAQQQVRHFADLCRAARDGGLGDAGDELLRFGFETLPRVLATCQYRNGQPMVGDVADALRDVASPADTVDFLVARAENEPRWIARVMQGFFDQHAWRLAQARKEARKLDARLEKRLLALVTRELRDEMRFGSSRGRAFYDAGYDTFWKEKADAFAAAALAELNEGRDDEAVTQRVATYFWDGLRRREPAVELLRERHRGGRLGLDGQWLLAQWLVQLPRPKEARPIAEALVVARPDALEIRFLLMKALAGLDLAADADLVRVAAEARLRETKRWGEEELCRQFGWACYEAALWQPAADYYGEAITLHTRSSPTRGIGDGVLAPCYERRSEALAKLGRAVESIDAAAGAVVAWGPRLEERSRVLRALESALASAADLDGYVARIDAEVAASGMENPLLRKAIGKAWRMKRQPAKAEAQWRAALEADPDDEETAKLLVALYDETKRPADAVAALFARLDANDHDVATMRELGDRLARLEEAERAERVRTQLVEALVGESEGHLALAEIRDAQKRWSDAAEQWREVARIRAKEPTGLLGLAKSLLRAGDRAGANEAVDALLAGTWETRFGDVKEQARQLLRSRSF